VGNKDEPSKAWRKDFTTKIKGKAKIPSNHNCDISVLGVSRVMI
jgi:hypothetical protein